MANGEDISDLEAVDFALSGVIAGAFENLADAGPQAWRRFVSRSAESKIFFAQNEDVQAVLRRIARSVNDKPDRSGPDLPVVVYYRDNGLGGDSNQYTTINNAQRFVSEGPEGLEAKAMRLTCLPISLNYSLLFLAWDRPTLERMVLAWWGYIVPLGRKHSRFLVPYVLAGESLEVGANIAAPRDVITSSENLGDGGQRLWGARTTCEVTTQALYGAVFTTPDYVHLLNSVRLGVEG